MATKKTTTEVDTAQVAGSTDPVLSGEASATTSPASQDNMASTNDAAATGVADPAPATVLDEASGAIIEPAVLKDVDLSHPAIDANPRAGTSAVQNQIDMNDPERRTPNDLDFVGLGIDPTPYGKKIEK